MRRYGWPSGQGRPSLSPYTTSLSRDGVPNVTDDDYEYIASDQLRGGGHNYESQPTLETGTGSRSSGSYFRPPDEDDDDIPQDDVLLFRRDSQVDKEFFPPYSIGDGKLFAIDLIDRVQLLYKLSDSQAKHVGLFYKGKSLKIDNQPVCLSGVKNNSEIVVLVPPDDSESISSTEVASSSVTGREKKTKKKKQKSSRKTNPETPASSSTGLDTVKFPSIVSTVPAAPGSPMDKLNNIALHFEKKLQPLCEKFIVQPPSDPDKRLTEHRKISETAMQQVILKLDEVDTGGDSAVRARRKELVTRVQEILKEMDKRLGKKPAR